MMKLGRVASVGLLVLAGSAIARGNEAPVSAGQPMLTIEGETIEADKMWSTIQRLHKASASDWKHWPTDLDPELRAWRYRTLDLHRQLGLRFAAAFPQDPRRWEWLVQTADYESEYQKESKHPQKLAEWSRQRAELVSQCLAAEDATEEQKLTLSWTDLHRRISRGWTEEVSRVDFPALQEAVLKLGQRFPTVTDYKMDMPLSALMVIMQQRDITPTQSFVSALAESPNPALRAVAEVLSAREAIRRSPMELRFTAIDGRQVDLDELRGKVVLVNFTGITWCYGCRLQEPFLKAAYKKYHDQGFEIVSITNESGEAKRSKVLQKLEETDLPWPHYFDGQGTDNPYIRQYGVRAFPTHFLLDRNGLLVSTAAYGDRLDPMIGKYLELPPPTAQKSD